MGGDPSAAGAPSAPSEGAPTAAAPGKAAGAGDARAMSWELVSDVPARSMPPVAGAGACAGGSAAPAVSIEFERAWRAGDDSDDSSADESAPCRRSGVPGHDLNPWLGGAPPPTMTEAAA